MTVDFNCQRCDASFEVDFADLVEGEGLQCPNCDAKAPKKITEEVGSALDELMARVAELRPRFLLSVTVEADDLPPPYDEDASADEDEDEEEESDEDEADDDDDDDVDEDEDVDDADEDEDER